MAHHRPTCTVLSAICSVFLLAHAPIPEHIFSKKISLISLGIGGGEELSCTILFLFYSPACLCQGVLPRETWQCPLELGHTALTTLVIH